MFIRLFTKEYDYCQDYFTAVYDTNLWIKYFGDGTEKLKGWEDHIEYMKERLASINKMIFEEGSVIRKRYENHIQIINGGMTVTYDLNGGNGSFNSQWKAYNEPMTIHSETPTRDGYVFTGWIPLINGNYINPVDFWYYKNENAISPNINPCYFAKEITLKAQWEKSDTPAPNTITLDAQKGTVSPSSVTFVTGESVTLPTPSRDGYIFQGWSTSKTATTGEYKAGTSYTFAEGDTTLYAIWKAGVFNIIYDANEGTFSDGSTQKTDQKTYNASYTIPDYELERDGYTFSGKWSQSKNGSGKYKAGKSYTDIGGSGLSDKHLYAVWEKDSKCTVTYDYNNAADPEKVTETVAPDTTYTIADSKITEDFKGWMYLDPAGKYTWYVNGEPLSYSLLLPGSELTLTGDLYLYAKWDYFVHYTDGSESYTKLVRNGKNYTVEENDNDGFSGWKVKETGAILEPGAKIDLTSDLTLTATYKFDRHL